MVNLCQMDRTLPFGVPAHLRHRILGRDRNQHMNMVKHQVSFFDLALSLSSQLAENFAEMALQLLVQDPATAFRNGNDVVFILLPGVLKLLALPIVTSSQSCA